MQSIFFSTSKDLVNWTPIAPDAQARGGLVFKCNTSEYKDGGRWDCIAVLPREGGGHYGYWTATPLKDGGAGFGQSDDGLHWTTLPTPGPKVFAEVGGPAQLGGKTFMTFNAGYLFEAAGPAGPFEPVATNYKFLTQEGRLAFPRIWGELYTGDANLSLVTHQQLIPQSIYLGLVKRVVLGNDGVLRVEWWGNNDVLRGPPLTISPVTEGLATECTADCINSGLWLEGTLTPRPVVANLRRRRIWAHN